MKQSAHFEAMKNRFAGNVATLEALVVREFNAAFAKAARANQQDRRRRRVEEQRGDRDLVKRRVGRLYVHCSSREVKLGMALVNECQRAFGAATATYWPQGVGYASREKDLGECNEKQARALLQASETLTLAVFVEMLVTLGREVLRPHSTHTHMHAHNPAQVCK